MAHLRGRSLVRGPRRSSIWSEGPRNTTIQSHSVAGKIIWNLGQTAVGGVTIVRIRGAVSGWLEVVTTIGDGFSEVAFGIGIVSQDAFAIGGTAMPGPISDPGWDWMWIGYLGAVIGLNTTERNDGIDAFRLEIDTKAMRKMQPNQTIFGILETESEIGAATLSFGAMTRMLAKLG